MGTLQLRSHLQGIFFLMKIMCLVREVDVGIKKHCELGDLFGSSSFNFFKSF